MRLDHLLSKEHLGFPPVVGSPGAITPASVRRWLLMGGTLTIRHGGSSVISTASAWNVIRGVTGSGTLLGPEGTRVVLLSVEPASWNIGFVLVGCGGWLVV